MRTLRYIGRILKLILLLLMGIGGPFAVLSSFFRDEEIEPFMMFIFVILFPYTAYYLGVRVINRERQERGMKIIDTSGIEKSLDPIIMSTMTASMKSQQRRR